jgi:hypothetical protein
MLVGRENCVGVKKYVCSQKGVMRTIALGILGNPRTERYPVEVTHRFPSGPAMMSKGVGTVANEIWPSIENRSTCPAPKSL